MFSKMILSGLILSFSPAHDLKYTTNLKNNAFFMKITLHFALFLTACLMFGKAALAGPVLDAVRARGQVNCGVNLALAGFSIADSKGHWTGLDAEYCRALAAAVFDDPEKVKYVPLNAQQRFTALQSGEVDVLARNTTWTLTRDAGLGISFVGINFFDGQGFIVRKADGVESLKDLDGAAVCVQTGTTTELNLADAFRKNGMEFKQVAYEGFEESVNAFFAGRCDAYTTDGSALAVIRAQNAPNPDDYIILKEFISKEPLGPAVQQGDAEWFDIARWTLFALINAEELGLSQANVATVRTSSTDPEVKRFLGVIPGMGKPLGLTDDWAYRIVRHVGNYGETYERTLGMASPMKLNRSFNRSANKLWTEGGLMYAPPVR
jgi:general L-amino acid transport system substrate-binding protein